MKALLFLLVFLYKSITFVFNFNFLYTILHATLFVLNFKFFIDDKHTPHTFTSGG